MGVRRKKRIVAVFGGSDAGNDALEMAEQLGYEIAVARKQILLTGGRKAASKPVKHRAIQGARGYPWIGVHRKESAPATCKPLKGTAGLVLTSDLDEKRNYLEAWMCDARHRR